MFLPPRQRRQLLAVLLVLPLMYLYWPYRTPYPLHKVADDGLVPAKDTLGVCAVLISPCPTPSSCYLTHRRQFRRILVINRPARTDRRAAMETAAAHSGLALTFVDGITTDSGGGGGDGRRPHDGARGSWLAHLAALDRAIAIATADDDHAGHVLILEDDVDWDVRIRTQMAWIWAVTAAANTKADMDVLWLGHCGADVPAQAADILAVGANDPTVPAARQMRPHAWAGPDAWPRRFAPRARLVHTAGRDARCSLAYGLSPGGARKLQRLGRDGPKPRQQQQQPDAAGRQWDGALAAWCAEGRLRCYAVNPPVFAHWVPAAGEGGGSDIAGVGGGFVRTAGSGSSAYIRWSVRLNAGVLGTREKESWGAGWEEHGEGLEDQWPD